MPVMKATLTKPRSKEKTVSERSDFDFNNSYNSLSAQEIATLRKEAQAFKSVRAALRSATDTDAARLIFQKV